MRVVEENYEQTHTCTHGTTIVTRRQGLKIQTLFPVSAITNRVIIYYNVMSYNNFLENFFKEVIIVHDIGTGVYIQLLNI